MCGVDVRSVSRQTPELYHQISPGPYLNLTYLSSSHKIRRYTRINSEAESE
jgi:hypothetical protein